MRAKGRQPRSYPKKRVHRMLLEPQIPLLPTIAVTFTPWRTSASKSRARNPIAPSTEEQHNLARRVRHTRASA